MIKTARRMIEAAEAEGLKLLEIEAGARHFLLLLENEHGAVMRQPISKGSRESQRDEMNARAQFRRFARGNYHGLMVKERAQ